MRLLSLLSYSLPASILLTLAACGSDGGTTGDTDAKFASATEPQRQRAVIAASGNDAAIAFFTAYVFTDPVEGGCPTVTVSGDTTTATFNCTDDSGQRVDGLLRSRNLAPLFGEPGDFDPTKDQFIEFENYKVNAGSAAESVAYDGTVVIHPDTSMDVALEATLLGYTVFTDATFTRAGELTSATAGSIIELDGVGGAEITGAWNMSSEDAAGKLDIKGADTLRADFDAMDGGCVPLTIGGSAAGELCLQE